MATGQQQETELESKEATKWIEDSLSHLIVCLKGGRPASDLNKWPEIPKQEDHSKRERFIATIDSISEKWDVYWERCTELRRTDVQKAIIQIEKLTSKSPSGNLKGVEYHTGMLKDPVIVKLQDIWKKMSNVPFTDVKTEEFTKPENSCLNEWFLAYLQYLETVLNLESNTYFEEDLIPQPPQQTDEKILQSQKEIVVSWQELWSSKLTTEDKETIKYIEAIHQISGTQLEKHQNTKKLKTIAKYFVSRKREKKDKICESTRTDLPEDSHEAFKLGIYEKILNVLNDSVNIDIIEPPSVSSECDENLKKQLYAEFQTTMVALKKKVNKSTESEGKAYEEEVEKSEQILKNLLKLVNNDLPPEEHKKSLHTDQALKELENRLDMLKSKTDSLEREILCCKSNAEEKVRQLQEQLDNEEKARKAYEEEVEKSKQNLKNLLKFTEFDLPPEEGKKSLQTDEALNELKNRFHTLKSKTDSFEGEISSCKSKAEEEKLRLQEQLDQEVKARKLLQDEDKLKSEILEKTLDSILSSEVQSATEYPKNKNPEDMMKNVKLWIEKMQSYKDKFELVKLNEKNEKSSLNFKLLTMEELLIAFENNTMRVFDDVNAELESCDEKRRNRLQKWYQKKQKRLESMLLEKDQTQRQIANLKQMQAELEENKDQLLNRLSQVAGAKLKENNPNITDLSDPNRPLKLAEQFSELYDKEWTNALEELGKAEMEETSAIDLLLESITKCYQFCLRNSEESLQAFLMCNDLEWRKELDADENHLLSETRKSLAKVHIRQIKQRFLKEKIKTKKSQKNLRYFIEKSLELSWYMVIQNPPIHMEENFPKGAPLVKSILKEYTISGDIISYLVWPPLYLHKDGPLLSKGVAQPQPKPRHRRQRQSKDHPSSVPK